MVVYEIYYDYTEKSHLVDSPNLAYAQCVRYIKWQNLNKYNEKIDIDYEAAALKDLTENFLKDDSDFGVVDICHVKGIEIISEPFDYNEIFGEDFDEFWRDANL